MHFLVNFPAPVHNLDAIESALFAIDPAAGCDLVRSGRQLRVASVLDADALRNLLAGVGLPVAPAQVDAVPSECCGGCGG
jgi:hypothetical protein